MYSTYTSFLCNIRTVTTIFHPQKGTAHMKRAVDLDQRGSYAASYKEYLKALDFFMLAIKCMTDG